MIELFLSTDGKHTVHASAETFEELTKVTPQAKALYQKVLSEFGGKVQFRNGVNGANGNGQRPMGKRIDTVEQAREVVAPQCPKHEGAMVYREGRRGPFWSCPVRDLDGKWCKQTREMSRSRCGQNSAV